MAEKKNAELKLVPTDKPIEEFLEGIENPRRRADAEELVRLLREVTGEAPVVWTYGIVGFGDHHYRHSSGREGDVGRIGFAPRKANLVLYGFNSAPGSEELLQRLGVGAPPGVLDAGEEPVDRLVGGDELQLGFPLRGHAPVCGTGSPWAASRPPFSPGHGPPSHAGP